MRIEPRPDYKDYRERAEFWERSYEGGDDYREGKYLNKRDLESDDKYARRLRQATYTNYCAPIVDTYVDYLMGGNIERDYGKLAGSPSFDSFLADADGAGRSYKALMTVVARLSSVQGGCAVVVDKPAVQAETRAQELAAGARPYCAIYEGYDIIDWSLSREGWRLALDSVTLAEPAEARDRERYRIWTREGWQLWDQPKGSGDATLLDEGTHALGVVPVVFVPNRDSGDDTVIGRSDLHDLAETARKIYNIDADIEEIRASTAFPFLELPERRDEHGNIVVIGPGNAITFDPDQPQARAAYVEPDHASIKVMLEERARAIEDLRWQSRLAFDVTGESRQVPSGYALEVLNEKLNALLRGKAARMEAAERRILALYAAWEGMDFDGNVTYPRSFGLRDLSSDIDIAIKAQQVVPSATFRREQALRMARLLVGDKALADIERELQQPDAGALING